MAVAVIMPKQGNTVESCILSKWYVKPGDKVKPGDLLFNYETDKSTFDEECKDEGTVLKLFFEEGDEVEVCVNVMVIGNEGEDADQFAPKASGAESTSPKQEESAPKQEEAAVKEEAEATKADNADGRIFISKRAKLLADKAKVDIAYATPTGPYGRIIERDIEKLIRDGLPTTAAMIGSGVAGAGTGIGGRISIADAGKAPSKGKAPAYVDVKIANIRKVIAKSMTQSLSTMAQLTLNASFDATAVIELRKRLKANGEAMGLPNFTLNDVILFAVSRVIQNYPDFNAHFMGDFVRRFSSVNLGIAVDTERGLMVPTLANAEEKSIWQISKEAKELAKAAQSGTINPDLLTGGTFTITNLGSLGIESFTPIINPPQTAILGVNNLIWRTKEVDGELVNYQAMGLSLTIDHRIIDGAPGARFLKELCNALENFDMLLIKETL